MRVFGWKTLMRNESEGASRGAEVGIARLAGRARHYRPIVTCDRFE